jgi:hypothetical protein
MGIAIPLIPPNFITIKGKLKLGHFCQCTPYCDTIAEKNSHSSISIGPPTTVFRNQK